MLHHPSFSPDRRDFLSLGGLSLASLGLAASVGSRSAWAEGESPGLRPLAYRPLPLGRITPLGWLLKQLRIQAAGLSGHLDEFWPDIKDSAWIGGKAEGWERVPYWLDGLVPLAYLLDDARLKGKVQRYLDYILEHQQTDGWLGPISDGKHVAYDPWPLFPLLKALTQFYEATADKRVLPALSKILHKIDEVITKKPLFSWAHFRAADLLLTVYWLYDRTKELWLLKLADKVHRQAFDWRKLYERKPFRGKGEGKGLDGHGVNTAMGLKTAGVWYRQGGDPADRKAVFAMLAHLDRYHGQATGIFTCDEHLAGRSPSQGTELCTVIEAMFSLEVLLAILGEPILGDRLERLAFNALPATFKPDMCAHQYDQQANQVVCQVSQDRVYVSNGPDANIFGLEPNFGCCTANMHQGWPKFASHLWMQSPDGGLAAIAYAPCRVQAEAGGKPVQVEVQTNYPFRDTIRVMVHSGAQVRFPLHLRIPGWAEGAEVTVSGRRHQARTGAFLRLDQTWSGNTEIVLRLPLRVSLWEGFNRSAALVRGPLVYALQIGSQWKQLKGKVPFADWEVFPTTPWNYALQLDPAHLDQAVQFTEQKTGDRPFSPEGVPVFAKVKGRRLPSWGMEHNAAAPPPESPVTSSEPLEELTLAPYGCTSLRVTEFPVLARD